MDARCMRIALTTILACSAVSAGSTRAQTIPALGRGLPPGHVVLAQSGYVVQRKRPLIGTTGPRFAAQGAVAGVDVRGESFSMYLPDGKVPTVFVDDHTQFFIGGTRVSFLQMKPGARVSIRFFWYGNTPVADEVHM